MSKPCREIIPEAKCAAGKSVRLRTQFNHPGRRSRRSSASSHGSRARTSGHVSGGQGVESAARIRTRTLSQGE
jgi:hypothetical protein